MNFLLASLFYGLVVLVAYLTLYVAAVDHGGQGLHHRRRGYRVPGVRQEEAHGRHGGAVRGSMRMILFIDVLIFS